MTTRQRLRPASTLLLVSLLWAPTTTAQPANQELVCAPADEALDRYAYLRALSLDLRGRLPTLDEYAALDAVDDVPEALIDEWLASDEFAQRVVRRHRDLLWNNIDNQRLLNNNVSLRRTGDRYWRRNLADDYRGDFVPCLDEEVTYNADGTIATTRVGENDLEGWVWVNPYWDPAYPIKVCAFDAQDALVTPQGTDCATRAAYQDLECGCGPDLRWCYYGFSQVDVVRSMAVDIEMRVADNVRNDEPYLDLFTGRSGYVNGPLSFFWRYQTGHRRALELEPSPMPMATMPELDYTDRDTWVEVMLSDDHAGILTSPAFLLRFQTDRARANRLYSEFLCQPFVAPRGGLPAEAEDQRPNPDLQLRDGCNYCHAQLEPAAAYWGRWQENGVGHLDPDTFPPVRDDCYYCATTGQGCSAECNTNYITRADFPELEPYLGHLDAYLFLREQHMGHVDQGPAALVLERTVEGQLPDCTTRSTSRWLLGRELGEEEDDWIWELAQRFIDSDYSYRQLVRAIVTSDTYRRVR